jgi:hypothetical protein
VTTIVIDAAAPVKALGREIAGGRRGVLEHIVQERDGSRLRRHNRRDALDVLDELLAESGSVVRRGYIALLRATTGSMRGVLLLRASDARSGDTMDAQVPLGNDPRQAANACGSSLIASPSMPADTAPVASTLLRGSVLARGELACG